MSEQPDENTHEPHATNLIKERLAALENPPLPRSQIAATRQYHAHRRAVNLSERMIDAIAELPVNQRAGVVLAIIQGVIDRTGQGQARAQFLEDMLGLVLHRVSREIEVNTAHLNEKDRT